MATRISDLIDFLHQVAPGYLQEDYDNAGLIIGDSLRQITGVLVTLDSTEEVVDEAVRLGCNLIIAHHPIVFRGLKRINGNNYIERTVIKAIKHDVAIFAIHTNLDKVFTSGVNTKIAEKIGLTQLEILQPVPGQDHNGGRTGAGMTGYLNTPMDTYDFFGYLKQCMELQVIRHTEVCRPRVHKVAVCGGSGSFLLQDAIRSQADIYITADFKYHEFFDADRRIIIADIGHYESEKFTIELLYHLIINNFSNFAAHYTKVNTNPVKFY